jgi:ribulose-phosphate 3-epimerase
MYGNAISGISIKFLAGGTMVRTIRIVPAILTDNAAALEKLSRTAETFTDYAQYDFMDGHFVPSNSFSVDDMSALKTKLHWEAHLMMLQPEDYLETLKKAGAEKIIFHFEAVAAPWKMIMLARGLDIKVGMAINPETPLSAFKEWVPELDSVLFMAVHPGFYGAKFIPEVLDKVKEFRKTYFKTLTSLDGGVKEANIADIARAGVDEICVGSAIFQAADPGAAYRKLTDVANAAV